MYLADNPTEYPVVSIRSRLRRREKSTCRLLTAVPESFNPLPAETPGEIGVRHQLGLVQDCFNPLPAETPGEIRHRLESADLQEVSIRSRLRRREKCRTIFSLGQIRQCFNPLPAETPGEIATG